MVKTSAEKEKEKEYPIHFRPPTTRYPLLPPPPDPALRTHSEHPFLSVVPAFRIQRRQRGRVLGHGVHANTQVSLKG